MSNLSAKDDPNLPQGDPRAPEEIRGAADKRFAENFRAQVMARACVFQLPFGGATAGCSGTTIRTKIYCSLKGGLCVLPNGCGEPECGDPGF